MVRIFVSHAAKDEELVEDLVDLLQVGVGIHPDDIFCSSLPGMNIPTGTAFIDYIKSKIAKPELVLLVVSSEFLKSQFCNNEVGASWALSLPMHPLLVPPLDYEDVRGVLAGTQVGKLNDRESLNYLRDDLIERLAVKALGTSHWERKRDRFLSKLVGLGKEVKTDAVGTSPNSPAGGVISSTGPWLKLGDRYFKTKRFERRGSSSIQIEIETSDPHDEAALVRLRPDATGFRRHESLPFAFQNDGGFVNVGGVTSVSHGERNLWTLELTVTESKSGYPMDVTHNLNGRQYTSDDLAEMKAGRLLIDNPPAPRRRSRGHSEDFLESLICDNSGPTPATNECLVRKMVQQHGHDPESALRIARLESVFILKAASIVGTILELSLGPTSKEGVQVCFRGIRPERNQSEIPETIVVQGICKL